MSLPVCTCPPNATDHLAGCPRFDWHLNSVNHAQTVAKLQAQELPKQIPAGYLQVGNDEEYLNVVVNHPQIQQSAQGGHMVFSPAQAKAFAALLVKKAEAAEKSATCICRRMDMRTLALNPECPVCGRLL